MQTLGLVLILLNIGAILAPVGGVLLMHSYDLSTLVIPPEFEEIISNTMRDEESIELPQYISSSYDPYSRTAQVVFSFTNPFEFDLTLNTVSASIKCIDHNFALGNATLKNPVEIRQKEVKEITIMFVWTEDAVTHFLNEHIGESAVDVKLVDNKLDVSGISIEVPEEVFLSVPIIS